MNAPTPSQNPTHLRHTNFIAIGIFLIAVATVAVGVMFFGKRAPEHAIALTFTAGSTTAPYLYDTDNQILVPADKVGSDLPTGSVVSKSGKVAYLCTVSSLANAVCVWDPTTKQRITVSHNNFPSKSDLSWSPDGAYIMYVALTGSLATNESTQNVAPANTALPAPPPFLDPNQWGVFLARADGSHERQVGIGSTAFFSPDGTTVFYLGRLALFAFDIESSKTTPAWPIYGGFAQRFMEFAVSPDGTRLAWSDTLPGSKQGSIRVYTVRSWKPLYIVLDVAVIPRRAWSLAFSPDSSSVAFVQYGTQNNVQLWTAGFSASSTPQKVGDFSTHGRDAYISDWY